MDDMQPIGPTRHYVIVCHDGGRVEVDAESMWPARSCLEFWATLDVIGPRQVCVRRIAASELRQVEREDGLLVVVVATVFGLVALWPSGGDVTASDGVDFAVPGATFPQASVSSVTPFQSQSGSVVGTSAPSGAAG
jgi:hypothetical protein